MSQAPWTPDEWARIVFHARNVSVCAPIMRRFRRFDWAGSRDESGLRYWRRVVAQHAAVVRAFALVGMA